VSTEMDDAPQGSLKESLLEDSNSSEVTVFEVNSGSVSADRVDEESGASNNSQAVLGVNSPLSNSKPVDISTSRKDHDEPRHYKGLKLLTPSVFIVAIYIFLTAAAKGLIIVSLWGYIKYLDGDKLHLGLVWAVQAIGKGSTAIPLGMFCDVHRHRATLVLSSYLLLMGCVLYIFAPFMGGLPMLYIAQFVLGTSSGGLASARSFVSEQTQPHRRTYVMSRLSSVEFAGVFLLALPGALLAAIGSLSGNFLKYALPMIVLFCMGVLLLHLLYTRFEDIPRAEELTASDVSPIHADKSLIRHSTPTSASTSASTPAAATAIATATVVRLPSSIGGEKEEGNDVDTEVSREQHPSTGRYATRSTSNTSQYEVTAGAGASSGGDDALMEKEEEDMHEKIIYLVLFINFALKGSLAAYEAIGTEILQEEYNLSIIAVGAVWSSLGMAGFLQMLNFKKLWTNYYSDAMLLLLAFALVGIGSFFALNWSEDQKPTLMDFIIAMIAVIAIGIPIGISVVC